MVRSMYYPSGRESRLVRLKMLPYSPSLSDEPSSSSSGKTACLTCHRWIRHCRIRKIQTSNVNSTIRQPKKANAKMACHDRPGPLSVKEMEEFSRKLSRKDGCFWRNKRECTNISWTAVTMLKQGSVRLCLGLLLLLYLQNEGALYVLGFSNWRSRGEVQCQEPLAWLLPQMKANKEIQGSNNSSMVVPYHYIYIRGWPSSLLPCHDMIIIIIRQGARWRRKKWGRLTVHAFFLAFLNGRNCMYVQ